MARHPEHWTARPVWQGQDAFIVAGGPSAREIDFERLRGKNVIAVNSSYTKVPFAPCLFFCDLRWWREHEKALQDFPGEIVTNGPIVPLRGTRRPLMLQRAHPSTGALSLDPKTVVVGKTSTHGAINLAVLFGASTILLIGVDMAPAQDGATHHHDPHPWPVKPNAWDEQMLELNKLADAVRKKTSVSIINTSVSSRLTCWPKHSLERFL